MMSEKLTGGIAQGDTNGVGYELILKVLGDNRMTELFTPVLIGSSKVASFYRKKIVDQEEGGNVSLNLVQKPEEAAEGRNNIINCLDDEFKVEPGAESQASDQAAVTSLKMGLDFVDRNRLDFMVSAPMGDNAFSVENAASLIQYLAARYETDFLLPLFIGRHIKMAFLSSAKNFNEAISNLTVENIVQRLKMMNRALVRDFSKDKPMMAVLALNASVGDGMFGEEEEKIIKPAIQSVRDEGIMACGPYAADRFFAERIYEKFDAVLVLHNDQGMIPFKSVEEYGGSVLIAGLPFVFTTTVGGMAFDIAGKGTAEETSMRDAVYLAIDVYRNRKQYSELTRNHLRHYEIGGDRRESEMNVEQIAGLSKD